MLAQNTYYVVPVVNVDGVAYLSKHFLQTGEIKFIRKNMNPITEPCNGDVVSMGVDLNRNYGVSWDKPGGSSPDQCAENYRGAYPFSEPETRAIRDFLISKQHSIKFVYNFHAYGNMYLWPYNS
jgi:carboxypeptidase T